MNVYILGAGFFGTAIANQLAENELNKVTLLSKREDQVLEINSKHTNFKYYPNKILNQNITATHDIEEINSASIIFIAVPSNQIKVLAKEIRPYLTNDVLIVNLSKGLLNKGETIVEYLQSYLCNKNVVSMKGATFAQEMMNNSASLFTLGFDSKDQYEVIKNAIKKTNIFIDYTSDIRGVEILSVLKNIYAILIGIVDAKYNSANTRFMLLTKSFSEIKKILWRLGGKEDTIFLSAGFGDLGLTALNDLSRNRTLGLLIGKGFYNPEKTRNSVVLEGVKAVKLISDLRPKSLEDETPLLNELARFFSSNEVEFNLDFSNLVDTKMNVVLTYGTFDLLHYGHLEVLRKASEKGDKLIVGLSTDEFNLLKGKKCILPYKKRKELLESLEYVDIVIPENDWEQKISDVQNNNVDVFVMGNDWEGKFDFLKDYCKVVYFERTKGISTTKLKSILDD
jgi:glycerol-3-phosphate dehydrogenase (NAD(P)+)